MPQVFTDRSLGDRQVPEGLRAAGFEVHTMVEVHTMAEVYGQAEAQSLDDPDWIRDMTECELVLLSKDAEIKRAHARAIVECSAKAFLLPEQQVKAKDQIARYVHYKHRIARRALKPGPFIYMVRPAELEKVTLPS